MYDVITSLGYNCEVSFRLENYFEKINAMPFSWSFELDRDLFLEVLDNIDDLFSGEVKLWEDQMICDLKYQIKFHPRYDILRKYGEPTEETYAECVAELKARVEHLKEKYKKLLVSGQSTLFIMKVEDKGEEDNIAYVKKVMDVLQRNYISGRYTLAAVFEEWAATGAVKALENDYADNCLRICTLKKFAPKKHTDTMGDTAGWKRILRELTEEESDGYDRRLFQRRKHWLEEVLKNKTKGMIRKLRGR